MAPLEQYIQSYFGVDPHDLHYIASQFRQENLMKGEFYLRKGHISDRLSFIHTGLMRIYADAANKEITQWISSPGYFITDLSGFIFETPARWNICALTDVSLYTISRKDYLALGQHIPKWHELEKLFIAKCFTILEDRIFSHLSMSAEERYHTFFEVNRELFKQVPLQYIASMLGMTPETFSRIRKKTE